MSIVIYHKNLRIFAQDRFTKTKDIDYYKQIGSNLIVDGFSKGCDIKKQIAVYLQVVNYTQNTKLYKLTQEDKDHYIACVLALWKLEIFDPESATDPIYISPKYRRLKKYKIKFNKHK